MHTPAKMTDNRAEQGSYSFPAPAADAATRRPGRTNRTQHKLFNAALAIMSVKGPSSTTVEEVALAAGVSKGTVYYNFGSKKTMVDQLLQYGAQLLADQVVHGAQDDDPRAAVRGGVLAALRYLEEHPGFARLWIAETWKGPESWSATLIEIRGQLIEVIEKMLQRLSSRYSVDSSQDIRTMSVAIFGSIFMLSMDREVHSSPRSAEESVLPVMLMIDSYIKA